MKNVTMSFGVTKISNNDKIESLTKRADNNMYESKRAGQSAALLENKK